MDNLQALREKVANLARQAKNLLADKGDQIWTTEDQAKFDGFTNDINLAKSQIKAIEAQRDIDADNFFADVTNQAVKKPGNAIDLKEGLAIYMRNGFNVEGDKLQAVRNAMSTTTTTEGGFTVPSLIASMVIDRLKAYGGMREVATPMPTDGGNDINFPGSDGTSDVGEIVGQNSGATNGDIVFSNTLLKPFYYSSKKIAIPLELIQDSGIDIVAYVLDRLATRIARIQNTHFTVGTGTTQPDGVIPRATLGKTGTTGQTLTVIYDDLVDLKHSVNRAYRRNAKFMMNDLSVAVVSKLKETTGRPIWETSLVPGTPDTLLGFGVVVNDDVATMAANAKSIAFGDFSKYYIRDVNNTTQIRRFDDSAFALNNQVGFCGWQRSGGNLLDVQAVKYYANSAT
ncbi:COG4653 Predicted phage phi-C31 gp36 major capsid-like protein [uncultured Caudovirales phage]|uniref:COG4653 Predicted phage phi-C31 gp36 major capsid-like protein n=1 Tax=uncultured Caudovirales phage TaxID=2100421 RepID=A0A6J5P265_9CAUD|nr:COG4653 Predicted phage phi-C31 gp36 major capsid-like protein [uncultured Caudovirales phage]